MRVWMGGGRGRNNEKIGEEMRGGVGSQEVDGGEGREAR